MTRHQRLQSYCAAPERNLKPTKLFGEIDSVPRAFLDSVIQYSPEVGGSPAMYEIRFAEKTLRLTPWELVTHVLGNTPAGSSWRLTYFDAIRLVEAGTAHFCIMRSGLPIRVDSC